MAWSNLPLHCSLLGICFRRARFAAPRQFGKHLVLERTHCLAGIQTNQRDARYMWWHSGTCISISGRCLRECSLLGQFPYTSL